MENQRIIREVENVEERRTKGISTLQPFQWARMEIGGTEN